MLWDLLYKHSEISWASKLRDMSLQSKESHLFPTSRENKWNNIKSRKIWDKPLYTKCLSSLVFVHGWKIQNLSIPTALLNQNNVHISDCLFRLSSTFTLELCCSMELYQGYNSLFYYALGCSLDLVVIILLFSFLTFSFLIICHVRTLAEKYKVLEVPCF